MSTDRALLEKAAKAAGYVTNTGRQAERDRDYPEQIGLWNSESSCWNPLVDDAHALRLAVQIGPLEFSISEYGTAVRKPKGEWFGCEAHLHGGKQAATRRAIVRAAAAIGGQHG